MLDLLILNASGSYRLAKYPLKEGFSHDPPLSTKRIAEGFGSLSSASNSASARLSQLAGTKKALYCTGGSNSSAYIIPDIDSGLATYQPTVVFGGTVWSVEINSSFYAIAGDSPYLYVYKTSDDSYVPVDTAGLGRVYKATFNQDKSRLVVIHDTAPYIRVYNTSNWTYVVPPSGVSVGANRRSVCFTANGQYIFTTGQTSPYIQTFKADLSEVVSSSTSSSYYSYYHSRTMPHPTKENKVIATIGITSSTNRYSVSEFDAVTGVNVPILPFGDRITCQSIDICPELNKIYIIHSSWPGAGYRGGNAYSSVYDLSTYQRLGYITDFETQTISPNGVADVTVFKYNLKKISGTVRSVTNAPVARKVRAFDRVTSELVGEVTSNATTGNYQMLIPTENPVDVQFVAADGELLNDLFYARVTPEPVS